MFTNDQLIEYYNAARNINIKTFLAFNLIARAFEIKTLPSKRAVLKQASDFLHLVALNDQPAVLPDGFRMPKLSSTGSLARITQRNPDILLWKIMGNKTVHACIDDLSEEDHSRNITANIITFTRNIKSHLLGSLYEFLSFVKPTDQQKSVIYGMVSTLGTSADDHKIWRHNIIISSIIIGQSNKLCLQPSDVTAIIYGLLLLQCMRTTPCATFGLFDLTLQLEKINRTSGIDKPIPTQLLDLLWYRLALMFWALQEELESTHKSELGALGFEKDYWEYFLPLMALFCGKKISTTNQELSVKIILNIQATLKYLIDSPTFATPAMSFLDTLLDDSFEYHQSCLDSIIKKSTSLPIARDHVFTIFKYMRDFVVALSQTRPRMVLSLLCRALGEAQSISDFRAHLLAQRDAQLALNQQEIQQCHQQSRTDHATYQQLVMEFDSLSQVHTTLLQQHHQLAGSSQDLTQRVAELEKTVASQGASLASLTQVLTGYATQIEFLLSDLHDRYTEFSTCYSTPRGDLLKSLGDITSKIRTLHTLAQANITNPQLNFNLFFCRYLMIIYQLCNLLLNSVLQNTVGPGARYISLISTSLLKYQEANLFLANHIQHLQEDPTYYGNVSQLESLYEYITVLGRNLSANIAKLNLPESDSACLMGIQTIGELFVETSMIRHQVAKGLDVRTLPVTRPTRE